MTAPSLIQYAETSWSTANVAKSTASITWLAGDVIVALAADENQLTIPTPTFAGGTFTAITGAACTAASCCAANAWSCTPGSGGSGTVSIASTVDIDGLGVWVWRGSAGIGNVGSSTSAANNNLTQSLIRSGNNSCVVGGCFDWAAISPTGYGWTPAVANDRQHGTIAGQYSYYVANWGDQGSAGTTSYGITGISGAGPFARLFIEVLGTASTNATATPAVVAVATTEPVPQPGSLSGPAYAAAAAGLGGGTGSWANPGNADGAPDSTYAVWTVV